MKKMLPALAAVLIAVSMSAFTTIADKQHKKDDLHWFVYNPVNNQTSTYLGEGDRADFTEDPCAELTGTDCRRGYPEDQLKNIANPAQGVNDVSAYEANIKKP